MYLKCSHKFLMLVLLLNVYQNPLDHNPLGSKMTMIKIPSTEITGPVISFEVILIATCMSFLSHEDFDRGDLERLHL